MLLLLLSMQFTHSAAAAAAEGRIKENNSIYVDRLLSGRTFKLI